MGARGAFANEPLNDGACLAVNGLPQTSFVG